MDINITCMKCMLNKIEKLYDKYNGNQNNKMEFMQKAYNICSHFDKKDTAPELSRQLMNLFGEKDLYYNEKKYSNDKMMCIREEIENKIKTSKDSLYNSLKYAMIGNFIDFGAMDEVDDSVLDEILNKVDLIDIDKDYYKLFSNDLSNAKKIVYLTDNAGELVCDYLFLNEIRNKYNNLEIEIILRGAPIFNDATIEDAELIGLTKEYKCFHNGINMPGNQLDKIDKEALYKIKNADLIISKGQGNFESLAGCGENIYYVFLCKCNLFVDRFGLNLYDGVFINEKYLNKKIINK